MTQIEKLLEVMRALRDPQTGCPWDLEQDFATIAPYTVEEAYEVADAIEREDWDELRSELGDLLFQVVFYAQMASEKGFFEFDDIASGITDKMTRRHPHVFGDVEEREPSGVRGRWEDIKEQERAQQGDDSALAGMDNCEFLRLSIRTPLKMSLTVGQPTSGIKLGKYFKVKVTLAKLFDVLVYQLG